MGSDTNLSQPFVSVVVPVFNAESTIRACVEALVAQDYPPDRREIIFVDNRCSDRSSQILSACPVRLVQELRLQGPGPAKNRGIRSSRGELLAFTDSDCMPSPYWLSELVKPFADPMVGASAGKVEPVPPKTLVERYCAKSGMMSQGYALNHPYLPAAQTCNVAYRRSVLERIGLFDEGPRLSEDTDLAWRLQKETDLRMGYAPDAVVYHKHRTSARGLFWQYYYFGFGEERLSALHPDLRLYPLRLEVWDVVKTAADALRGLPEGLARLLLGKMTQFEFAWVYLVLVTRSGRAFGRCRARAMRRLGLADAGPDWRERRVPRLEDEATFTDQSRRS